jgi:hypothetical protein
MPLICEKQGGKMGFKRPCPYNIILNFTIVDPAIKHHFNFQNPKDFPLLASLTISKIFLVEMFAFFKNLILNIKHQIT